jgi:hypothetical protein
MEQDAAAILRYLKNLTDTVEYQYQEIIKL